MNIEFAQIIEKRRSHYVLEKSSPISKSEIEEIVTHAVKHVPTSFNSQSGRVLVLFGEEHDKVWEITREELRKIVAADDFGSTNDKIDMFKNSYGTILFFEDMAVIEGLQKQFELYKDNFPIWSLQSNGMLQYTIWLGLDAAGLGATLQHYNPLIDDQVKAEWKLPKEWKLLAQMPFGKPAATPDAKEFSAIENRVKVFG